MNIPKKYIIAVSGGVDSVVLLHKIVIKLRKTPESLQPEYIVAHFDHGIRKDSSKDAEFVKNLAIRYGLENEVGQGRLGKNVSEAVARQARYEFLRKIKKKYKAEKIITAHHQDDVLETMIINIIRGTGTHGLIPMSRQSDILRPLINQTKQSLLEYAKLKKLQWHEDSTNEDEKYLRNYIRIQIAPKIAPKRQELVNINKKLEDLLHDIDLRIANLVPKGNILIRTDFVVLPYIIQKEIIRAWFINYGVRDIDKVLIEKCVIACKTLKITKKIDINGKFWLTSSKNNMILTSR